MPAQHVLDLRGIYALQGFTQSALLEFGDQIGDAAVLLHKLGNELCGLVLRVAADGGCCGVGECV